MGARTSAEMKYALHLVRDGMSITAAARESGISRPSLHRVIRKRDLKAAIVAELASMLLNASSSVDTPPQVSHNEQSAHDAPLPDPANPLIT